ncbi:transposase [Roseobacter weihaiensis]|uniref:transposase n=1 Tax=Roseobacter weihaiensis TaxID=2763262 RepID=UPI0038733048
MAQKRYSDEDILRLLREIELSLSSGSDVATACRTAGVSDATYYTWRKRFGGMHCPAGDLWNKSAERGRSEMANLKALQKENDRLKMIVAELELDKLTLKESLDYLKPKVPLTGR